MKMNDIQPANANVRTSALVTLGLLAVAGALTMGFTDATKAKAAKASVVSAKDAPVQHTQAGPASYAQVVKKVTPSVVKITTVAAVKPMNWQQWPGADNPMLRRFFGDQLPAPFAPRGNAAPRHQQGLGSGVIVSKDGFLVTNNHVVDGADEVKVTLQDGREFTAKVVGKDPKSDVAVLKVETKDLPSLELADSDKVEVGDVVLAIGNPFGIGQTVTMGIVSATGRGNMGLDYEDFIQTDASINPGNSGGALVDTQGRLVGINTAILSRSGGNQGIGFAIPANLADSVMTGLIKDGHVSRGFLGVGIQDLTPDLAKAFGLKETAGALVGNVTPDSPAARAGLKSGDVITAVDGKPVENARQLKIKIAAVKPGATAALSVKRDGADKSFKVTLGDNPDAPKVAHSKAEEPSTQGVLNGVGVADLDNQVRHSENVPAHVKGAVVTAVEPGSPAAEAGLKPGDIIEEINRKPVGNAEQAVAMTEKSSSKRTLLKVWSGRGSRYVVVDESKAG
jgi:serine protease Do